MDYKTRYSKEKLQGVAKILKTISHPIKLEILLILGEFEPMDVTSICENVGEECQISMMSHHLAKMKDNGILSCEKIGKQVYYRIEDRHILSIFKCIDSCELV